MTKGDAGQNISKFASSSTEASKISTSLPYVSYVDLSYWLSLMFDHAVDAFDAYFKSSTTGDLSPSAFFSYCRNSSSYSDVFACDSYRYVRAAKLLMSLGYGNCSKLHPSLRKQKLAQKHHIVQQ